MKFSLILNCKWFQYMKIYHCFGSFLYIYIIKFHFDCMKCSLIGSDSENSEKFMQWIISWSTVYRCMKSCPWNVVSCELELIYHILHYRCTICLVVTQERKAYPRWGSMISGLSKWVFKVIHKLNHNRYLCFPPCVCLQCNRKYIGFISMRSGIWVKVRISFGPFHAWKS